MHILQTYLINISLWCYHWFSLTKRRLFAWIGHVSTIHYVNQRDTKNITLNYYTGWGLKPYTEGKYYVRVYTADSTQYMGFKGTIVDIPKAIATSRAIINPDADPLPRKKIVFLDNERPIDLDLRILDSYYRNIQQFGSAAITNMSEVTALLGIKCTHVSIIESRLFKKTVRPIGDTDLEYLYTF